MRARVGPAVVSERLGVLRLGHQRAGKSVHGPQGDVHSEAQGMSRSAHGRGGTELAKFLKILNKSNILLCNSQYLVISH